jgi:hypothetical protein
MHPLRRVLAPRRPCAFPCHLPAARIRFPGRTGPNTSLRTRKRTSGVPGVMAGLSSIWPHSRAMVPTMRTIWVIFVLALITVTGEIYADAVMTSSLVAPAAPDPAAVAIGHATKPG